MERLWITEPARKTCLAEVQAVEGEWFSVDRALFAPRSTACRHPQYADDGTIWLEGEKRRLAGIRDLDAQGRGAGVWYRLRGVVPTPGQTLQCELDQQRRDETSRTHTGMHLMLHALAPLGARIVACEVKGGGHFRLTTTAIVPRHLLAAALKFCHEAIRADHPITWMHASQDELHLHADAQAFDPPDPYPGPDPVAIVDVGVGALPCDGSHVDRTGRLSSMGVTHAAPGKDGFVTVVRVA